MYSRAIGKSAAVAAAAAIEAAITAHHQPAQTKEGVLRHAAAEGLELVPSKTYQNKVSGTPYQGVIRMRGGQFGAQHCTRGKTVWLGSFALAEEAALAFQRHRAGKLPPPPVAMTPSPRPATRSTDEARPIHTVRIAVNRFGRQRPAAIAVWADPGKHRESRTSDGSIGLPGACFRSRKMEKADGEEGDMEAWKSAERSTSSNSTLSARGKRPRAAAVEARSFAARYGEWLQDSESDGAEYEGQEEGGGSSPAGLPWTDLARSVGTWQGPAQRDAEAGVEAEMTPQSRVMVADQIEDEEAIVYAVAVDASDVGDDDLYVRELFVVEG